MTDRKRSLEDEFDLGDRKGFSKWHTQWGSSPHWRGKSECGCYGEKAGQDALQGPF